MPETHIIIIIPLPAIVMITMPGNDILNPIVKYASITTSSRKYLGENNKENTSSFMLTYPIYVIDSLFSQSVVHIAILSPLFLTLTTAPHASSLCSSNASPIRHNSFLR